MSSGGSSPFVDNPKYSNSQLVRRTTEDGDTVFNNRQTISNLQYQVAALTTEKRLLQQEKEIEIGQYEDVILQKNEQYNKLKLNFDYLYQEKKELESKIENQNQIQSREVKSLNQKIAELVEEANVNLRNYNELEAVNGRLKRKYEQVSSNLNFQLNSNDHLTKELDQLKGTIQELHASNDQLIDELENHTQRANDPNLNSLVENLHNKNINLQNINNKLQSKVDELLQKKTSAELLKQKNISLTNRISSLESIEVKYCKLEIEKLELEAKFNDFFTVIEQTVIETSNQESNEEKVKKFIGLFKDVQNNNLVLRSKYDEAKGEIEQIQLQLNHLQNSNETNLSNVSYLEEELQVRNEIISKLERERLLNVKEIEFLRNSLKRLDEMNRKKLSNEEQKVPTKATDEYLTKLELLVDEYKTELEQLRKNQSNSIGNKRPRNNDNTEEVSIPINFSSQLSKLEKENFDLSTKIKDLESSNFKLQQFNQNLQTKKEKQNQLQILQLRSNLIAQDQVVKKQTLDALRNENNDLINNYVKNLPSDSVVPKSIFERQEHDKSILEDKISQLTRRNERLKDVYAKKSKDILSTISKYFGYGIEFLPNPINPNDLSSRIKLVSKFLNNPVNIASNYLIIDVETKNLKAYGDYDFKLLCEELSSSWVKEREQIPCFLSALNLSLYEFSKKRS
ncbi:spindle assembly checkpoint component Mad1 [Scheffersomyces coipomensis]|uniref:spindle assembly checkpoint component Mad1 n=1 Tax=Scheffersomyces coipomensis TaxID=1788519 RepID=UPI00315D49C5